MDKVFELYSNSAMTLVTTGVFTGSGYKVADWEVPTLEKLFAAYPHADTIVYLNPDALWEDKGDYGDCIKCGAELWAGEDDVCIWCESSMDTEVSEVCTGCRKREVTQSTDFYPYCEPCAVEGLANMTLFQCTSCNDVLPTRCQDVSGVCDACYFPNLKQEYI